MRIAHVVVTDAWAGVEAHVARLARAQAAEGHSVAVIGGSAPHVQQHAGPEVLLADGTTVRRALLSLRRLPWKPTIVHSHMTAAELAATLYTPVLSGQTPMVVTRHLARTRGNSLSGRMAAVLIRRRVAGQIAISAHTARHIDGVSTVVLAGVEAAEQVAHPDRSTTVLVASRLEAEKRVDLAVRAFAAARLNDRGWRLLVAGDGACRSAIEKQIADLGLTADVDMLGQRSDVRTLMSEAAIFLAPTPSEGLGLSVLEAMAAGLPVVADGSGGHLESLGPPGALGLFRSSDPDDAARRIRMLADDPHLRLSYGADLRRRQEQMFTLAAQQAATDEFYRGVLA